MQVPLHPRASVLDHIGGYVSIARPVRLPERTQSVKTETMDTYTSRQTTSSLYPLTLYLSSRPVSHSSPSIRSATSRMTPIISWRLSSRGPETAPTGRPGCSWTRYGSEPCAPGLSSGPRTRVTVRWSVDACPGTGKWKRCPTREYVCECLVSAADANCQAYLNPRACTKSSISSRVLIPSTSRLITAWTRISAYSRAESGLEIHDSE